MWFYGYMVIWLYGYDHPSDGQDTMQPRRMFIEKISTFKFCCAEFKDLMTRLLWASCPPVQQSTTLHSYIQPPPAVNRSTIKLVNGLMFYDIQGV